MSLTRQGLYEFGPFRLNPPERLLLRDGQPVALPPKAYDLLVTLVMHSGRLVSKEELLKDVWPGTFVEEANLSYTVSLLRKALGDDSEPSRYIETVPKRGYRFNGAAVVAPDIARGAEEPVTGSLLRRRVPWLIGALVVLSLVASAPFIVTSLREKDASPTVARLALVPPKGVTVENAQISPDGRRMAFTGREAVKTEKEGGRRAAPQAQTTRLWVQALDSTAAYPLPGTEGAVNAFWAPDSEQLAFNVGAALKKVDLSGRTPQTLCQGTNVAGTWSRTGVILFQTGAGDQALSRVSASGGVPLPATRLDSSRRELSHSSPHFLPDGRHFLYVVRSAENKWSGLYVGSLDSSESKRLLDTETAAIYTVPGHLLFSRDGAIVAQQFDMASLELKNDVIPIALDADYQAHVGLTQFSTSSRTVPGFGRRFGAVGAMTSLFGAAVFSASETGLLAYSLVEPNQYQFGWFDRHGVPLNDIGPPAPYFTFDLSPDGRRLVVGRPKIDRSNFWLVDLDRNVASQITFGRAFESNPRWGADGRRLMASAVPENGARRVVEIGLDGHQSVVLGQEFSLDDWSRDSRFLLYRSATSAFVELRVLPLFGDRSSILVRRATAGLIDQSRFAPDGRSIAYHSSESGRLEVYVTRFPPTGEQSQVSADGGVQPVWRRDGRELYYLDPNGMIFAVEIEPTNLEPAAPRPLFRAPVGTVSADVEQYATVDGNRFLIMKPIEQPPRPISVIVNWPATINGQRRR